MRLTDANSLFRPSFTEKGASHATFAGAESLLVADGKPASGGYTVDMYLQGTSDRAMTAIILSKGAAVDLGLPSAPFGSAWPDGTPIPGKMEVPLISSAAATERGFSSTVVKVPGSDPNIVYVDATFTKRMTGDVASIGSITCHRHAYSAADWMSGLLYWTPATQKWTGLIHAVKVVDMPLTRAQFWDMYVAGALAKVTNSDARAKLQAELDAVVLYPDMTKPATLAFDFEYNAETDVAAIGRGMGAISADTGVPDSIYSSAAAKGNKVVNGENLPGKVIVRQRSDWFTHWSDGMDPASPVPGHVCIPGYSMSYRVPVGASQTLLVDKQGGRVLAPLTTLCSEVFPCSLDSGNQSVSYVALDELFAAVAETSTDTVMNSTGITGKENSTPAGDASLLAAIADDQQPLFQDTAAKAIRAFGVAVRRACS